MLGRVKEILRVVVLFACLPVLAPGLFCHCASPHPSAIASQDHGCLCHGHEDDDAPSDDHGSPSPDQSHHADCPTAWVAVVAPAILPDRGDDAVVAMIDPVSGTSVSLVKASHSLRTTVPSGPPLFLRHLALLI